MEVLQCHADKVFDTTLRPGFAAVKEILPDKMLQGGVCSAQQWMADNLGQRLHGLKAAPWADLNHRQRLSAKAWQGLGAKRP